MSTPADSPPEGWGYAKKRPVSVPPGVYEQPPLVLEIRSELGKPTTAQIRCQDQIIFFGQHTAEVAELNHTLERVRQENTELKEKLAQAQESKYFWKGVAMHMGYGGKPPKKSRIQRKRDRRMRKQWLQDQR